MNKKNLFLILYLLIPLLFIIPPIHAAPTATVVYPNGGEVLSGTATVIFTAQHDEWVEVFDANVWLSYNSAGVFDASQIASDLNLLNPDVCDFGTTSILVQKDAYSNYTWTAGQIWGKPSIFYFEGNYRLIIGLGSSTDINVTSFSYNESNNKFEKDGDYNAGLPHGKVQTDEVLYRDGEVIDIGGEIYLLYTTPFEGGANDSAPFGWKYNGTANQWERNYDINSGIETSYAAGHQIHPQSFEYAGENWLIVTDTYNGDPQGSNPVTKSYKWDSDATTWVRNTLFEPNYQMLSPTPAGSEHYATWGAVVFVKDGDVYKLEPNWRDDGVTTHTDPNGFMFNGVLWEVNYDINKGLSGTDAWTYDVIDWEGRTTLFRFADHLVAGSFSAMDDFVWESQAFDTKQQATCSFSFDTTQETSRTYFLDLNIFDDSGNFNIDSSNAKFTITNWTDSDITCECISNCSSCVLDVNSFIVIPTSETGDVEIKINNLSSEKNVGYKIINELNTGDQYKIYTATENEFDDGLWALNDTLTYGSTNYDSLQKIWQQNTSSYKYIFADDLILNQTKYYKFEYYSPAYHWFTVNDSYWEVQLPPDVSDYNGLSSDKYDTSYYSNISNYLTVPKFPTIATDLSNKNYVFQFTANGDTAFAGEFKAGTVVNKTDAPPTSLNISNTYTTTTVTGLANGFLKMTSSSATAREITIQNYVVTERGYFTKSLRLTDSDGSNLPILIGDNNTQSEYIIEGKNFTVRTQYNDPNGNIDRYEISAYVDIVADANKLKKWTFPADANGLITIRETIGGLIDLTPNADNRTVIITLRLIDTNAHYYEIQTEKVKLRQFPTDRSDLTFNIQQGSQMIGEFPTGRIILQTIAPENLIGVELRFQDRATDTNNADFNKTFLKDTDFTCTSFDCSFDYKIEEYIFSTDGIFRLDGWALVTTEAPDYTTPFNDLLHEFNPFIVSWLQLSTARIFQTIERSDKTYRNDEVIPLVVQLMDSTGLPRTLASKVNVTLQLEECSEATGGRCRNIDLNYTPDSTMFDETTGYTYFHFRQLFLEEDYSQLSDGNYFRIKALLEDPTKTFETVYIPVLADKCQAQDPLIYVANLLTMNFFSWGCNSGQFTDEIVALPDSNSHEEYILIDEDHSVTAPTQYWWMCSSPDQNNLYSDVLAQDILCFTWYLIGEAPIDEFKFYLTNNNSDLAETNDDLKQYVEVSVPYEYIYFNDMQMLKESLKQEFSTDWTSSNLPNVGEIIGYQLDHHLGVFAPPVNAAGDFLTATGLIGNVGFQMGSEEAGNAVDFNFNTPLNPNNISGFLTYKIHNINVINKKDYERKYPELSTIPARLFTKWADMEGVRLKSETITIDVFVSDNVKVLTVETDSKLIIDEVAKPNPINIANADDNTTIRFESLPTKITFRAISDMIYNNKLTFKRRYLILPYTLILSEETMCGWFGINCWGDDSSGTITALVQEGDLSFFAVNAFGLFILLGALLIFSVIYRNFRRRSVGG